MNLQDWANIGQVVSGAATVVILVQLVLQLRKDREDRQASTSALALAQSAHANEMAALKKQISYETYMRANERYLDYLEICLHNPSLDIFEYADHLPLREEPEHPRQSLIAYAILIGTLEHGFVCSFDQDDVLGKKQYDDWRWYMEEWAKRAQFRAMWKKMRLGYDDRFVEQMDAYCSKYKVQESPASEAISATIPG